MIKHSRIKLKSVLATSLLIVLGVVVNVLFERLVKPLGLPLYLDTFGTVLVSLLGGSLPGVLVAAITTVVRGATLTWMNLYFGVINVFIAVLVAWFKNRGAFRRFLTSALAVISIVVLSGVLSAVLTWFVYSFTWGEGVTKIYAQRASDLGVAKPFWALFWGCMFIDLVDKTLVVLVSLGLYYLLPAKLRDRLDDPLVTNNYYGSSADVRRPLIRKVLAIVLTAEVLLGFLACGIAYYLYRDASIEKYTDLCSGVTANISIQIDPERVDEYIELGHDAEGYDAIESNLYRIKASFPEVEYVYCYKIEKRGCRVVFDLDSEDEEGSDPGMLIPFDESFEELLPALQAGETIDPIITDDTYGWLLTVYTPIVNSKGECVCYACADISMARIVTDRAVFISKMFSLFFAVSIIIMNVALELSKSGVVYPINAMAATASKFAYDTDYGRSHSLERLQDLRIDTGDEVSNLYHALTKMAEDSDSYINEVRKQSETISRMQEEIIMDFAEMVEARDKCTGDHIKKTSYYVEVIAKEMQREGRYPGMLTDAYIAKLVRSAPLHDVGKIKISDVILNKPGRLTDEEFELMKTHTTEGRDILTKTSGIALSSGYLNEAIDMAYCHHERWDGTGYPSGLSGEDIPLSARIMAVADVFDALVSQRSYKQPFSYRKAIGIIMEESGTHFDPTVVEAFLSISESAYTEAVGPIE